MINFVTVPEYIPELDPKIIAQVEAYKSSGL